MFDDASGKVSVSLVDDGNLVPIPEVPPLLAPPQPVSRVSTARRGPPLRGELLPDPVRVRQR
jgi:hypothetical protein